MTAISDLIEMYKGSVSYNIRRLRVPPYPIATTASGETVSLDWVGTFGTLAKRLYICHVTTTKSINGKVIVSTLCKVYQFVVFQSN